MPTNTEHRARFNRDRAVATLAAAHELRRLIDKAIPYLEIIADDSLPEDTRARAAGDVGTIAAEDVSCLNTFAVMMRAHARNANR